MEGAVDVFCPKCGKELVENARLCTGCGTDIQKVLGLLEKDTQVPEMADTAKANGFTSGETTPERPSASVPKPERSASEKSINGWRDAETAVGQNREYYLPEFQKVRAGEKTRFNWAAFFFGPAFCFYRRCGELFKKYFLASSFLLFFGCLVETTGIQQLDLIMMLCGTIIMVAGGILQIINSLRFAYKFNQNYYKHCQNSAVELPECTGTSLKSAICFYAVCVLTVLGVSGLMTLVGGMDLTQCVAWVILALLAWVVLKPYIMTFRLSKKNRAGIRTGLTADRLVKLIENSPWCEDQTIRECTTEIPGTHDQSQLDFVGVRSEVYFRIENGILHAYGFTAEKVEKFRRLYLIHTETRKLLQYIAALERQDLETAEQLKRDNISVIKLRSGYDKFDKLCWIIAAAAMIVLLVFQVMGIGRTNSGLGSDPLPGSLNQPAPESEIVATPMPTSESTIPDVTPMIPDYADSDSYGGTGIFDNFIGIWQDEYGYGNYLFIGYSDESKSHAYVYASTATAGFEAELYSDDGETATGVVMGGGSEPIYGIDITRDKYWLETLIYYSEYSFSDDLKFVPVDPATCPYANPYYTD